MAFSTTQKTQIFQIFGLPEHGTMRVVHQLSSMWGTHAESYDLSGAVTLLNAAIADCEANAAALARAQAILTEYYTTIGESSQMRVTADGTSSGTLMDQPAQLAFYRDQLSTVLGFYMPKGSAVDELRRRLGYGNRITK